MKYRITIYAVILAALLFGCADSFDPIPKIEKAHKKSEFLSREVVSFNLDLKFGGKQRMKGKLTMLTNSTKAKIELADGSVLLYDGDKAYHSPNFANTQKARFDAYTWPYFFLLPYKLADNGLIFKPYPKNEMGGKTYLTQQLFFEPGTGDDPDDWYILFADEETQLLHLAAYIVTAGKSQAEAEKSPSAISYHNYKVFNGVPFATEWKFHKWNKQDGITSDKGEGQLNNIVFKKVGANYFKPPENYIEAK